MSEINVDLDLSEAIEEIETMDDEMAEASKEIVQQLVILAEGAMKEEAPEGVAYDGKHMRDTIKGVFTDNGTKATVQPHKRTDEGWLLHRAIVGNPSVPSYGDEPPPVWTDGNGNAQGPLAEWCAAKLGDRNAAWQVAKNIQENGHKTFPNKFIDRSINHWQSDVEDVAEKKIQEALGI